MERPQKRARLGLAPHDDSDDDDELNYEPEEISQRRDPGARLARSRATAAFGLKSAFESIFERYERDFEGIADEIDLRTADIVVDNRHLQGMRNERDMGNVTKEIEEEIPVRNSAGIRSASTNDKDNGQLSQGKSSATVRKAPGTLAPWMPSSLGQRPGIISQLGGPPQLPPLGASPLFFSSWGPAGAMDPAWQAPQLQVPQFKSSFAADLFTGRYQLPAREASRSIWAPGSHDDDDDEDAPPEKPRMRLAPPTRRVPARPKAMKLIRAPPANADDSGDEDFILMGVNASQVPNENPKSLPNQQRAGMNDEADLLLDRLERELEGRNELEYGGGPMSSASAQPITRAEEPSAVANPEKRTDWGRDLQDISHLPSPNRNRGSLGNEKKGRPLCTSRKSLALEDKPSANTDVRSAPSKVPADHNTQRSVTKPQESIVIELPSSSLLDDGSYLDFSDMVDLLPEESHCPPIIDDHPSPYLEGQHNRIVEGNEDSHIPSSGRTIPDSQDQPVSVPASSASNAPAKQIPEKPRQDNQKQKDSSAYDLSDDEIGFLARQPRKRRRISDSLSSSTISERTPAGLIADTDTEALSTNRCVESGVPSTNKPIAAQNSSEALFSSIRTRSTKVKASPTGASLPEYPPLNKGANSTRRVPGKRRLTPTSLNSADDTEGETVPTQEQVNLSSPVALVSPPPETDAAGMAAAVEEQSNVQAEPLEPAAEAVVITDDSRPRSTRVTRTRTARGRPDNAAVDTALSSELITPPHDRLEPNALSPHRHRSLGESQNTINQTPHQEGHAKIAATGPPSRQFRSETPSKLNLSLPNTPTSVPSTGHRSLTSLVPRESPDSDSEDELTSSSIFSPFQKPIPAPSSGGKSTRRLRAPEGMPTKLRMRVSAVRLSAAFSAERPSAPEESVMRTPGGTIRKCGERGLKCEKDFCFTCC